MDSDKISCHGCWLQGGGGIRSVHTWYNWHSIIIVHNDIRRSRSLATALVLKFNHSVDFLPDAKHLSVVEKSALLGDAAWSHTWLLSWAHTCSRLVVVYTDL